MIINVHGGHSLVCRGASALLDEVVEDRNVKNRVIQLLRQQGHTVYDCTDDVGATQKENLSNIVRKCNSHSVDLDVSIHLNSGRSDLKGDGKTGGVEVYGYSDDVKDISTRICSKISQSLGITNRGFKINKSLYVLANTKAKAILIECCFVDDKDDAIRWNADKCAIAIVEGILDKAINISMTQKTANSSNTTVTNGTKYKVGQKVNVSSYYKSSTETNPSKAVIKNAVGTITKIIQNAHNPYLLDNGNIGWCNDGDIRGLYTGPTIEYYPMFTGTSTSIVRALASIGVDSSFSNRKKIAIKNGIANYTGAAIENVKLLSLLKQGKLIMKQED